MHNDKLIEQIARFMCAAYWRGKFETLHLSTETTESLIQDRTQATWQNWTEAAKVCINMSQE